MAAIGPKKAQVLVLGGGPVGLAVVQALVAQGTKKIIMSEVAAQRQAFAREFGAHHVLDPRTYDLVAVSKELTGGNGPDIVFDCAVSFGRAACLDLQTADCLQGVVASLETACLAIRPRGTVVNVAIWEKAVPFNPNMLVFKEGKYIAVLGYQRPDFEAVISAIADGTLKPRKMITRNIKMEDLVEKGIWALVKEKDKHVKILVDVKAR